jgi:flagellin
MVFQLGHDAALAHRERVGIRSIDSSYLGTPTSDVKGVAGATLTINGFLSSLKSGSANDLSNDPENALRIVDAALTDITDLRAYLGAFKQQTVDTNINSLSVAAENLTASESSIRDLDFAAETAEFTRSQILFQSGIAVLAQSNLISQSVLTLLG